MKRTLLSVVVAISFAACGSSTAASDGGTGGGTSAGGSSSGGTTHGTSGSSSSTGTTGSPGSGTGTSTSSVGTSSGVGTTGAGSSSSSGSTGASSSGGYPDAGQNGGSAAILLVDNDGYPGTGVPDLSLSLFESWLNHAGISYDAYLEPGNASDVSDVDPLDPSISSVETIIWFTGDNDGAPPTISPAQQALLGSWLNIGGKTLVVFSPGLVSDIGANSWTLPETNTFLTQALGFGMDLYNPSFANTLSGVEGSVGDQPYAYVSGGSPSAFSGKFWVDVNNSQQSSFVKFSPSIVQPANSGTIDVLAETDADPAATGTGDSSYDVAIGSKVVGTATNGTPSTVVWVGFSVENLSSLTPGLNAQCDFLNAVQAYAGLGGTLSDCGIPAPTVADAGPTLLVDNDGNPGTGNTDLSLPIFQGWLADAGGSFSVYQESAVSPYNLTDIDPADQTLAGIDTIVWFTGDNVGGGSPNTISYPQQALLTNWLNEGNKTLVIFSPGLPFDVGANTSAAGEPNQFLSWYLGFDMDIENFDVYTGGTSGVVDKTNSEIVSGSSTVPAFNGLQWTVSDNGANSVEYITSVVEPLSSEPGRHIDILATVPAVLASGATVNTDTPVAIGFKNEGQLSTSTVVYVGFTVENIDNSVPGGGFATQAQFLQAIQSYAAVP